ncbi:uncharacterized protein RAG0_12460 [Rhynchosporium agropyri]|uniref:Uncharacterized protein n=1 Tax=Rhynchosporium agropyri TaxID=914238 RepID=A0A1E1LAX7_9HELO|nr:uncharacterized protein RAG0_12460 [Rhynchosporium agropyri]
MSFISSNSLQFMRASTDGSLAESSLRLRKRSNKQIMLIRYLKDKQRHEMIACNITKQVPKKEFRDVWRNLSSVLPELTGVGAWCQSN